MKPVWLAAFALPFLWASLSYSQADPPNPPATPPANDTTTDAKAVTPPEAAAPATTASAAPVTAPEGASAATEVTPPPATQAPEVTEAELREKLTGRPLFLRGLWLDETLHFNMGGDLVGQSTKGSFTLCGLSLIHI